MLQGCPASIEMMYEVVRTHAKFPNEDAARSLQLNTENATLSLLMTDKTLQLNRAAQAPELSCTLHISTVAYVVDLVPDTNRTWLGSIAGAKWMDEETFDTTAVIQAISDAGDTLQKSC